MTHELKSDRKKYVDLETTSYRWAVSDIEKFRNDGLSIGEIETKLLNKHNHAPSQAFILMIIRSLENKGRVKHFNLRAKRAETILAENNAVKRRIERDFVKKEMYPRILYFHNLITTGKIKKESNLYGQIAKLVNGELSKMAKSGFEHVKCNPNKVAGFLNRSKKE